MESLWFESGLGVVSDLLVQVTKVEVRSSIGQLGKSNREGTKEQFQLREEKREGKKEREREGAFAFKGMPSSSLPFPFFFLDELS